MFLTSKPFLYNLLEVVHVSLDILFTYLLSTVASLSSLAC